MKWEYKQMLPEDFSPDSKVWIYQSNRRLTLQEALELETILQQFVDNWLTHGTPVRGYANLFFGQFIVLMADETSAAVSGCSTDQSVRLIKSLESRFQILLFDRELLAFVIKDTVQLIPLSQFSYAYSNGFVNEKTLYFNNLVNTKKSLEESWMIPLGASWLAKKLETLAAPKS